MNSLRQVDRWNKPAIGTILLLYSFVLGCQSLFWRIFVDEGDNLVVGWLMSQGYVLYRDLFSHHFPLAYYWVAGVTALFGPSIFAVRLSLLIFQTLSFALVMRLTRFHLTIGLASVFWALIGPLYYGHMLLYDSLNGIALAVIFLITIAITGRYIRPGNKAILTLGIFMAIALLSDPLSIYSISLVFLTLLAARIGLKKALSLGGIASLGFILFAVSLLLTGSLGHFFDQAIFFNMEVYSKYFNANPLRLSRIFNSAVTFLEVSRFVNQESVDDLLWRLAIFLAIIILLGRRRFLMALFIYLLPTTLLLRTSASGFHTMAFVIISVTILAEMITHQGWLLDRLKLATSPAFWPTARRRFEQGSRILLSLITIGFLLQNTQFRLNNWQKLSYKQNFEILEGYVQKLKLATCNLEAALAYYPMNPYFYFLAEMRPASKYTFLLPWVAEVGLAEVINNLETSNRTIVFFNEEELAVWDGRPDNYLSRLKAYLDANYVVVDERNIGWKFYISPQLSAECPNSWPEVPSTGSQFQQSFVSHCMPLNQVNVVAQIDNYPIAFQLKEAGSDKVVYEETMTAANSTGDMLKEFDFEPLPDSLGKTYVLSLAVPPQQDDQTLTVWRSHGDVYSMGQTVVDGNAVDFDLAFRYTCQQPQ